VPGELKKKAEKNILFSEAGDRKFFSGSSIRQVV